MTIINIRGTSGAGKSHLVRRLMEKCGAQTPFLCPHPEKPGKSVVLGHHFLDANVVVMGRYATPSGGCDNFSWKGAADWLQEKISSIVSEWELGGKPPHVVFEGVLVSQWKTERFVSLARCAPLRVVLLSTPLNDCLEAINARRWARGNENHVGPATTMKKYNYAIQKAKTDRAAGLSVAELSRGDAYMHCCELLGLGV